MKRKGRRSAGLWQSVDLDERLVLCLKAAVLLYTTAAPFVWRDVAVDLTPVYAIGFVLGTLVLSVDFTLGALFLMAVAVTMVTIGRKSASAKPPSPPPETSRAYEHRPPPAAAPFAPLEPSPPREGFSPAPEPPVEETSDGERAPEDTVGPHFLLKPDGEFVTESSLAAAQTNRVGPDDVYSPLGAQSYSVQGRARDVPVVPMVW